MKNTLILVLLGFLLGSTQVMAQTAINVKTGDAQCLVALISDEEAAQGEYGWWSVWQDLNKNNRVASAPTSFNASPGTYTLVVFWDNNNGESDGIALEKIHVASYISEINYSFHSYDFTEWNCLSCPWLCIYNGTDYVKHSEVLQDVTGYENRTTTSTLLSASAVIDGKIQFRIQEEKDEVSFIDKIQLKVGGDYLPLSAAGNTKLSAIDDDFITLKKGDKIDLEFDLPDTWNASIPLHLEVSGYYEPEAEFLAAITNRLLNKQ